MIHNYKAEFQNVRLRPLIHEDIESLRCWRNDKEATRFLRDIGFITREMQEQWFQQYKSNDYECIFAIEEITDLNRMVGSLSLYNIHNNVAEIGKIQIGDVKAHGRGIGKKALVMAMLIGFNEMKLHKIIADVHQDNKAAHKNDIEVGFEIVGKHTSHVGGYEDELMITYENLLKKNPYIFEIMISH